MFLTERELKEVFWKNYNYAGRAIKYQFESPIRSGNADLITVEKYQGNFQLNAFEFKLSDIKKVILQAKGNIPYVHKSWIVIPSEKKNVVLEKYIEALKSAKHIGVITVEEGGRWEMVYKPFFKKDILLNQEILNLLMSYY